MESQLVEGRTCGACNVCCVALTIDDPELQKAQGHRCANAQPDNSCAIYEARPQACRRFYCGWRLLKWVRGTLRPDSSGVLIRLKGENAKGGGRMGVIFALLNKTALNAEGLAESIAAAVAANLPVYLDVPGPPGYTSGQARIDKALEPAVRARDKPALLAILKDAYHQGLNGEHKPIILFRK